MSLGSRVSGHPSWPRSNRIARAATRLGHFREGDVGNWTIGKKLYAIVGALALLLTVATWFALWSGSSLNDAIDTALGKTTKKVELALRIQQNAVMAKSEQRRLLVASFGKDANTIEAAIKAIDDIAVKNKAELAEIDPLLATAEGKKLVADVATNMEAWDVTETEIEGFAKAGKTTEAWSVAKDKSNPLIATVDDLTDKLLAQQDQFLKTSEADAESTYSSIKFTMLGIMVFSMLVVAGAVWTVRGTANALRKVATELKDGAAQVEQAASQVSESAQSLSQGSTEQAASLEETSASMEEMASMTRRNAENAIQAAKLVTEVAQQVTASNTALGEMVGSMDGIRESSNKVAKIIKTIDEIAFQTNILALNAAVEAARAGEAGMGFAVVADEVRNLAQRSAQAAKDTAGLIEESIAKSQEGQQKVEQVASVIGAITESVDKVKGIVEEVREASQQQTQGIDQVTQAIMQMEKVTQTTAATAEESAAASEELNAQAETSMSTVRELESMVGGADVPMAKHSAPAHKSKPAARVLSMTRKSSAPRSQAQRAEDVLPLEDTGTFGKF
jgi:methyl-accepting chemotaxis protein